MCEIILILVGFILTSMILKVIYLLLCVFIVVDSPSSSWTGALTNVYMTALDMILQWFILIATGALFINWAYRK